jgi:hypothetical protein
VTDTAPDGWSPADNPYAIAVSESQWWLRAARLAILRIRDGDDHRASFSSRQIDARFLVFALRQLLAAEQLQQVALKALDMAAAAGDALTQARERFEEELPDIKHMRDGLMHFEDWSRGEGRFGPQKERRQCGEALRDVARAYWGFAYDPSADTISLGPYTIHVDAANRAASELCRAIYMAAHEVDKRNTADLRSTTVGVLTSGGLSCNSLENAIKVSPGRDLRIWLSLSIDAVPNEQERQELSARVVAVLATAGLNLTSPMRPQTQDAAERLARGEALYAEADTAVADEPPE